MCLATVENTASDSLGDVHAKLDRLTDDLDIHFGNAPAGDVC